MALSRDRRGSTGDASNRDSTSRLLSALSHIVGLPRAPMVETKIKTEKEKMAEEVAQERLRSRRKECVRASPASDTA